MIPVLFKANAVDFSTYGIGVLADCISCEVTEERNGAYELVLQYPVTGRNYGELSSERIIKAKPNDTADDQAFRIYRITTPIDGVVTVYAQHISYDLSNIAALTWSSESISPALAMQRVFQNTATAHSFTCQTDYSEAKPFSVAKPQSVRACLGGVAGSFLDLWGGEYEWDNFHVIHHQGRGQHTGVVIEYGKNLTELEHDSDITEVYTDLLPYAVISAEDGSETVVTLTEVLLPITDTTLSQRKTLIRDFTDSFGEEETITEDALRTKAQTYLANNPLGVEVPALTVSFEPLWKQPEYAAVLERVSLCDTVTIRHSSLGITAKAKVITTVYDTLAEKYVSITLGSGKANLLNNVSDAQASAEEAAEKAEATLAKVGMAGWASHYPSELSGGQQQRVAIARAIACDPEIVYFDEPTSALDPELAAEVLSVMRMLAEEGMTMVVVTHAMDFARNVSSRVIFMEHGAVVEAGDTKEFFSSPKEERTRIFLRKSADAGEKMI